ncbi:MAG: cyclophilin-like fold protein [Desulfuromonadaceae bacterium]|nr:cyclophilin-like fold protein [Desulfuromonadaceae bacterium]MDD2855260.1 cyclophilin-like fold protein [Desulfuromonadaceae bacterium]
MMKKLQMILACIFISILSVATIANAQTMKNESEKKSESMNIRLRVNDKIITATMIDSKTTREFISLLPLTLNMNDLLSREKYAHLPKAISTAGKRSFTYAVGDIVYWSPGPDVAIYYRQDGERIPNPGIIVIGKIDSGVESLNVAGPVKVTIELIK